MKFFRHLLATFILSLCSIAAHGYTSSQTLSATTVNFTNQTVHWTNAVIVTGSGMNGTVTGARHTPRASSYVYTTSSGTLTGSTVCVSCYIYKEADTAMDIGFGVDFTSGGATSITCSVAGIIYSATLSGSGRGFGSRFEAAATLVKNQDPSHSVSPCDQTGSTFNQYYAFEVGTFMPDYNGPSNLDTCYYPVTNWCLNEPDADYNGSNILLPWDMLSGSMTSDSRYFPQRGGYFLTFVKTLYRLTSTSAWNELGASFGGKMAADPHYSVTSMAEVGCTSHPESPQLVTSFGPQ